MTDQCPYLEYRRLPESNGETAPRAYCTAAEEFVQPMRADICNDRYDLDHETDCEIFRDHEGLPGFPEGGETSADDAGGD
jgi:hypothetical protein